MTRLALEIEQARIRAHDLSQCSKPKRIRPRQVCRCGECSRCVARHQRALVAEKLFNSAMQDVRAGLRPRYIPSLAPIGFVGVTRWGSFKSFTWRFPLPEDIIVIREQVA